MYFKICHEVKICAFAWEIIAFSDKISTMNEQIAAVSTKIVNCNTVMNIG